MGGRAGLGQPPCVRVSSACPPTTRPPARPQAVLCEDPHMCHNPVGGHLPCPGPLLSPSQHPNLIQPPVAGPTPTASWPSFWCGCCQEQALQDTCPLPRHCYFCY